MNHLENFFFNLSNIRILKILKLQENFKHCFLNLSGHDLPLKLSGPHNDINKTKDKYKGNL